LRVKCRPEKLRSKKSIRTRCIYDPSCLHIKKNAEWQKKSPAPAAASIRLSAGDAGADFPSAKTAWKKISGGCPVTELPGSARIAENKTGMVTSSKNPRPLARQAADTAPSVRANSADAAFIAAQFSLFPARVLKFRNLIF
jgi:hypothetical protein